MKLRRKTRKLTALLLASIMCLPVFSVHAGQNVQAATPSAQAEDSGRTVISFNNDWRFYKGDVTDGSTSEYDDSEWLYVNTPHSTVQYTPENYYQKDLGVFWYRRHFETPSELADGRQALLTFGAAMQKAEVWLNDEKIGDHKGGYTEFSFDITDYLKTDGSDNVLAVRLDTRPGSDFAPGKSNPDFQYFGGLYRNVYVTVTEAVHITDAVTSGTVAGGGVFLTAPAVSKDSATVKAKTEVENEETAAVDVTVLTEIIDEDGETVVASKEDTKSVDAGKKVTFEQSVEVEEPRLWSVNTPELYTVLTTVLVDGEVCDSVENTYGIRKVEWKRDGCYINDERVELIGTNLHSEIYMLGNALSDDAIDAEIKRLREYGFNFIRMAHYPHAQAYYEACDRYGVVVLDCLAGWQNYSNTTEFNENCYAQMREMVRANRNFACVVAWEPSLNESNFNQNWATTLNQITKAEYPEDGVAKAYTGGWKFWNVYDIGVGTPQANVVGDAKSNSSKAVIVSEYGDWNMGGYDSSTRVTREPQHYDSAKGGDEGMLIQCDNIQSSFAYNRSKSDWYGATAYWQYSDYAGFDTEKLTYCGVVDVARIPKHSAYFFQSQRDPDVDLSEYGLDSGPMVYIANTWAADSPNQVRVYSNCDEVELYLDGELIDTRTPDETMFDPRGNYSDSDYKKHPSSTSGKMVSTQYLEHPPFTFDLSDYTPGVGELQVVGLIDGEECAGYVRNAPEEAEVITLEAENTEPLKLDGSSAKLVWVNVLDGNNTVVNTSDHEITFETTGPGFVIGEKTVSVRGGQWAVWVRSQRGGGDITLTAKCDGLETATLVIPTETISGLPKVPVGGDADETGFVQGGGTSGDSDNLALNKPATEENSNGDRPASYAVDGDITTHWCGEMGPKWWMVDLEDSYYVEEVSLSFLWAGTSDNGIIRHSFTLQSSMDGKTWNDIASWSDTDQTDDTPNAEVTVPVDGQARYLRVYNLTAIKQDGGANQWVEIAEFVVTGGKSGEAVRMDYGAVTSATSNADGITPDNGNDGNPQTFWIPAETDADPSWQFDAEGLYDSELVTLTWNTEGEHNYKIEISTNGTDWIVAADHMEESVAGGSTVDEIDGLAKYVRISVKPGTTDGFWINAVGNKLLPALNVTEVTEPETVTGIVGTELKSLPLPKEAEVLLEDGTKTMLPIVWDSKSYDADSLEKQTLNGTLKVISGVKNEDALIVSVDIQLEERTLISSIFEDVSEGDWFAGYVQYVYENGLMTGMDPTHFGPYGNLSRGQFALILYRMEGEPEVSSDKSFNDIAGDEWYAKAVLWAQANGIVTGYLDGNFGPADLITREQMALMMYRYADYLDEDIHTSGDYSNFADAASVSGFAADAMKWAVGKGIITGKENGTRIDPQGNTARAEAAAIIQRLLEN